jgi:xeroderma pigmentosum group C-complementing protein
VLGFWGLIEWLQARASHPVSYVVAWNNDNTLKDITKRYCTNFNTVTRKLRIDAKWWEDTLKSFTGRKNVRDKEEDEELERQQLEKPLPTSITE